MIWEIVVELLRGGGRGNAICDQLLQLIESLDIGIFTCLCV